MDVEGQGTGDVPMLSFLQYNTVLKEYHYNKIVWHTYDMTTAVSLIIWPIPNFLQLYDQHCYKSAIWNFLKHMYNPYKSRHDNIIFLW